MSVTRDDVRHVARLARLDFSEEEEARMAEELSEILGYVEKLDELDTAGGAAHVPRPGRHQRLSERRD
jgi:aspartyl/glutamyl-tRNA(Asn/Gln) amidotransferase subunit C (EC 6.3.5.-)